MSKCKKDRVKKVLEPSLQHLISFPFLCFMKAYLELASECVINENILLQTLGFSISVEHPHAKVVKTCTLVKGNRAFLYMFTQFVNYVSRLRER